MNGALVSNTVFSHHKTPNAYVVQCGERLLIERKVANSMPGVDV